MLLPSPYFFQAPPSTEMKFLKNYLQKVWISFRPSFTTMFSSGQKLWSPKYLHSLQVLIIISLKKKHLCRIPRFFPSFLYLMDSVTHFPLPSLFSYLSKRPPWNDIKHYDQLPGSCPFVKADSLKGVVIIKQHFSPLTLHHSHLDTLIYFRQLYRTHKGAHIPLSEILDLTSDTPLEFIKQNYKKNSPCDPP